MRCKLYSSATGVAIAAISYILVVSVTVYGAPYPKYLTSIDHNHHDVAKRGAPRAEIYNKPVVVAGFNNSSHSLLRREQGGIIEEEQFRPRGLGISSEPKGSRYSLVRRVPSPPTGSSQASASTQQLHSSHPSGERRPAGHGLALNFGVELELVIRPKNMKAKYKFSTTQREDWDFEDMPMTTAADVKDVVIDLMHKAGIKTKDGDLPTAETTECYDTWIVQREPSLSPTEDTIGYAPIEIISRVLRISKDDSTSAFDEIKRVYTAVESVFDIKVNVHTGTHMHVSVEGKPFTGNIDLVKKIVKMIALCDNLAITEYIPRDRRGSMWCEPVGTKVLERMGGSPKTTTFEQVFNRIDAPQDMVALDHLISVPVDSSWNYNPIRGKCGTIEFRRPPGSGTAAAALHWTSFGLALVQGALIATDGTFEKYERRIAGTGIAVKEMQASFLRPGAEALGINDVPIEYFETTTSSKKTSSPEKTSPADSSDEENFIPGVPGISFRRKR